MSDLSDITSVCIISTKPEDKTEGVNEAGTTLGNELE